MTGRRRFNQRPSAAMYLAADGRCVNCGAELEPGWHADHVNPHVAGGPTDVINGQALCPNCNLKKGSNMTSLRQWQQDAIDKFYDHGRPSTPVFESVAARCASTIPGLPPRPCART